MQRKSNIGPGDNILLFMKHLKLKDKPGKRRPQYVGPFKVLQMIEHNDAKTATRDEGTSHIQCGIVEKIPWPALDTKPDISR